MCARRRRALNPRWDLDDEAEADDEAEVEASTLRQLQPLSAEAADAVKAAHVPSAELRAIESLLRCHSHASASGRTARRRRSVGALPADQRHAPLVRAQRRERLRRFERLITRAIRPIAPYERVTASVLDLSVGFVGEARTRHLRERWHPLRV